MGVGQGDDLGRIPGIRGQSGSQPSPLDLLQKRDQVRMESRLAAPQSDRLKAFGGQFIEQLCAPGQRQVPLPLWAVRSRRSDCRSAE